MGFRKQPTVYKLRFEDEDFAGLEVTAKSLPLGEFLEFSKMSSGAQDPAQGTRQTEAMFAMFAKHLVSWNLEDEHGKPVPATYKGVITQEFGFVLDIIKAWMDAIASVPKAQLTGLNGSGTYQELSLPMEVS